MRDLWSVARKEILESFFNRKAVVQLVGSLLIVLILIDVIIPLTSRNYILSVFSVVGLGAISYVMGPLFGTADSFAGERERHTLETLLSTRISERTIVLGKLAGLLLSAAGSALFLQLQGLVAVSMLFGRWDGFVLAGPLIVGGLLVGILGGTLLGALGILVSSRAQTVQGAAQSMSIFTIPLFMGPALAFGFFGAELFPLLAFVVEHPALFVLGAFGAGILLDVVVLYLVMATFNRNRLMAK